MAHYVNQFAFNATFELERASLTTKLLCHCGCFFLGLLVYVSVSGSTKKILTGRPWNKKLSICFWINGVRQKRIYKDLTLWKCGI